MAKNLSEITDDEKATKYLEATYAFYVVGETLDAATKCATTELEQTKASIALGQIRKIVSDFTDHE